MFASSEPTGASRVHDIAAYCWSLFFLFAVARLVIGQLIASGFQHIVSNLLVSF